MVHTNMAFSLYIFLYKLFIVFSRHFSYVYVRVCVCIQHKPFYYYTGYELYGFTSNTVFISLGSFLEHNNIMSLSYYHWFLWITNLHKSIIADAVLYFVFFFFFENMLISECVLKLFFFVSITHDYYMIIIILINVWPLNLIWMHLDLWFIDLFACMFSMELMYAPVKKKKN